MKESDPSETSEIESLNEPPLTTTVISPEIGDTDDLINKCPGFSCANFTCGGFDCGAFSG